MFDKFRGKARGSLRLNKSDDASKNAAERNETYRSAQDESANNNNHEQISKLLLLDTEANNTADGDKITKRDVSGPTHGDKETIVEMTDNQVNPNGPKQQQQQETKMDVNANNNQSDETNNIMKNGNNGILREQISPGENEHLLEIDLKSPVVQNDGSTNVNIEASNAALKRQPLKPTANVHKFDEESSHDNNKIRPSLTVFLATFGALLGAFSMGLALGYTAPAFIDMERSFNENKTGNSTNTTSNSILSTDPDEREAEKSLIGSTLAIGALIASLASEPLNKNLGRRIPLIACGIPFVGGWLFLALANSVTMLIMGRLLIGACCGLACGIAPTYVVEIAPPKIRGALGTGFQLMVVIGNLLASVFGIFLPWQSLAAWSLLPALGMFIIMIFMPESPNWLLSVDRFEDARRALIRLRCGPVERELNAMAKTIAGQGSTDYSCDIMTSREFCRPLLLALGLMFFQQFTGINAVLMYQGDIFKKASPDSDPLVSTIWVCLAQVIATLVCSFLVDRLGRRILLWVSGAGAMITLIIFGTYSFLAQGNTSFQQTYSMVPLISLILFIVFFSFGFGPIPWMMIPEFTTSRVRSLVASFGACFAWTGAYIVTASMKPLIGLVGDAWTYWILAIVCASSCLFIFVLPETKVTSRSKQQQEVTQQ